MIKVVIADDEMLEREVYKVMLSRYFPNLQVVAEAETGRQAVEMYDIYKPQLMFMDVKMPGLNGIEAIQEIRKRSKDTKFIVISAYDFFDYAKEAIRFDVEDYLLKPVIKDEFIRVVSQVVSKIEDEKKIKINKLDLQEKLKTIEPIIQNECIFAVMMGDESKIQQYSSLLNTDISSGYVAIGMINEESFRTIGDINRSLTIKKVQEYIKNNMLGLQPGLFSNFIANKMIMILPWQTDTMTEDIRQHAYKKMLSIRNIIKQQFKVNMYFGIGDIYTSLLEITNSYNQALAVINNIESFGIDIVNYGDINGKIKKQFFYPYELEKQLIEKIRLGLTEQALFVFVKIFDYTTECLKGQIDKVKIELLQLYFALSRIVYESNNEEAALQDFMTSRDKYYEFNNTKEIYHFFEEDIRTLCCRFQEERNKQAKDIVFLAVQYIKQNYMKEITLEEVSSIVGVTPNYFSRLFKNELNRNFIEYVTHVRIESAKELMRISSKNISDICWDVGYNDPNYFTKVFKKNTGFTPSEFKEKIHAR